MAALNALRLASDLSVSNSTPAKRQSFEKSFACFLLRGCPLASGKALLSLALSMSKAILRFSPSLTYCLSYWDKRMKSFCHAAFA